MQVRVVDKFVTTTVDLIVSVGMPNFFIGVDGRISVGMRPSNLLSGTDKGQIEVSGPVYSRGQPLMPSHVGQIILTTTLDTAAKVQAIYGGTWQAWGQGRLICGVGSTTDAAGNSITMTNGETGGQKTHNHTTAGHTLTTSEMPSHKHGVGYLSGAGNYVPSGSTYLTSFRINSSVYSPYINGGLTDISPSGYTSNNFIQNTGGGSSHSHGNTGTTTNWPPYMAVYMWKRTA